MLDLAARGGATGRARQTRPGAAAREAAGSLLGKAVHRPVLNVRLVQTAEGAGRTRAGARRDTLYR